MKINVNNMLTTKQQWVLKSYMHSNWKYLICYGAVRSGKTFIDNIIFLMELQRVAKQAKREKERRPMYILAGYSSNSIQNNVISELTNTFGLDVHYDRHGHFNLFGVEVVPAYTGNVRGASAIRGMSSYGAYVNEASLATQEAFQEIIQRCSKPNARIICDTNPDNPQHWLKTDYIDNDDPKARIKTFHFVLDDNTFLPKDYIDSLKGATPSGMYYDRAILGLWVTGEGVVYKDFDKEKMVIDKKDISDDLHIYCGVDWGFEHKGVITVWGDDDKGNIYLLHEYTSQYKFIKYWVNLAKKIQDRYGHNVTFWADSARPDDVTEFQKAGINCRNANKSRMAGVERVAEFMKTGHFFVCREGINKFLDEIYQYVWDENTGEPKKENDDVLDSMRYAVYNEHRNNKTQFLSSRFI